MMFDWMKALVAFLGIMAFGTLAWMISRFAVWIDNKFGFQAGLVAVFVSLAIVFALLRGVSGI